MSMYFEGLDDWLADAIDAGVNAVGNTLGSAGRSLTFRGGMTAGTGEGEEAAGSPGISGQGATTNVAAGTDAAAQTAMPTIAANTGPDYLAFGTGHSWPERRISYDPSDINRTTDPGWGDQWFGIDEKTKFINRNPKEQQFLESEGVTSGGSQYSRIDEGIYIGPLLVDKDNQISKDHPQKYVPDEAFSIIASFGTEEERFAFLKSLEAKDFYGSGQVSATGTDSEDLNAVAQLLNVANIMGRTWDVAYYHVLTSGKYATTPGRGGGGGGVSIRYTNPADVKAVFQESAQRILGRSVDENTLNQFVDTYREMERQGARGSVQAPAVSTAAESQIEQQYGAERSAVGFSNLARIMDSLIRGGG